MRSRLHTPATLPPLGERIPVFIGQKDGLGQFLFPESNLRRPPAATAYWLKYLDFELSHMLDSFHCLVHKKEE
jgi:hypothetical protein